MKSLFLLLIPSLALATGKPTTPPAETTQPVAVAGAAAGAVASSESSSHSSAGSWSEGGNATGGESTSDASSNSGGNSLSTSYTAPRQAPSVGQGSLYIPSCGVAGNAGGSRDSGSAFLGFAFTPKDCKLLLVAASYQALGMVDAACEAINATSVARQLWKGSPPPCAVKVPPVVATPPAPVAPPVDLSGYATKADVSEAVTKAFRSTVSK